MDVEMEVRKFIVEEIEADDRVIEEGLRSLSGDYKASRIIEESNDVGENR